MRITTEVPGGVVKRHRVEAQRLSDREIEKWHATFARILERIGHKPARVQPFEAALPQQVSEPITILIINGEVQVQRKR